MGSRGPRPATSTAPTIAFEVGVPEPGDHLDDDAKGEYVRARDLCKASGRELQQSDWAILEIYAQSWSEYWALEARCKKEQGVITGINGAVQINPWFKLRDACFKQLAVAMARLGFTPADRARLNGAAQGKATKTNPLDTFI